MGARRLTDKENPIRLGSRAEKPQPPTQKEADGIGAPSERQDEIVASYRKDWRSDRAEHHQQPSIIVSTPSFSARRPGIAPGSFPFSFSTHYRDQPADRNLTVLRDVILLDHPGI
jgi:hypothetical protein